MLLVDLIYSYIFIYCYCPYCVAPLFNFFDHVKCGAGSINVLAKHRRLMNG